MIHYPPTVELSKLINSLKGVSSRLLRKECWKHLRKLLWVDRLWSPSYFDAQPCSRSRPSVSNSAPVPDGYGWGAGRCPIRCRMREVLGPACTLYPI